MLCLVIVSCDDRHDDEQPEVPIQTSFWEQSHLSFIGLNGPVSKVIETVSFLSEETKKEEETRMSLDIRFNSSGQLTYYNPLGEVVDTRNDVWQSLAYYSYKYDENGRMTQVVVTEFGEEPVVYTLQYGEHDCYVPLIFPLGPIDFFLVKGLESITDEDATVSYIFDGENAIFKESSWTGDIETKYIYEAGNPYPVKKIVTTTRQAIVVGTEKTIYTYVDNGELSMKDIREEADNIETQRTIIRYAEGQLLLPVSKKIDMGSSIYDWNYNYEEGKRLRRIDYIENKGSENEMAQKEEYTYLAFDGYGNWVSSIQLHSSFVDWSHGDGTMSVHREITY